MTVPAVSHCSSIDDLFLMPVFLGTVSSTMTQDYYKSETTKRYDIPLAHLDYGYIRSCSDVKELEKILRVLRWV